MNGKKTISFSLYCPWPALILAALTFPLIASGCASRSVGVGVDIGEGGKAVPGSEVGLAANEEGDFIESHPAPAPVSLPKGADSVRGHHVLKTAFSQAGKPYRYGGANPETGFDCSGFVRWVYGQYGISLPRRSGDMMALGSSVPRKDLRPGDLVFFGKRKTITHVGIYTGDDKYIHSPRSGKSIQESNIDDRGRGEYYVGARRLLKNPGSNNISDKQKMAWVEPASRSMALAKASSGTAKAVQITAGAEKSSAQKASEVKTAAKVQKHKVVAGDTFYKLARKYDVQPELLAKANKISNYKTAVLKPGQTLMVPGSKAEEKSAPLVAAAARDEAPPVSTAKVDENVPVKEPVVQQRLSAPAKTVNHKIESGDTFLAVAKKYGVKSADLARANNIDDINKAVLRPGKTLVIPAKGGVLEPVQTAEASVTQESSKPPASNAQPQLSSKGRTHTIENGDTFYGVAIKYGVKAADLAQANNIEDIQTAVLRPGKTLIIPVKSSSSAGGQALATVKSGSAAGQGKTRKHKVESGDTFYGVAKKYGVKSADLAQVNNIKDIKTAVLKPGQTLLVPKSSAN